MSPVLGVKSFPTLLAAAMSGGVSVDLDRSFLIQAVLFLFVIWALKPLLFDPVLRIFEEREKRTDGARVEAREMQEDAGQLLTKYEHELERVHQVAAEERDKLRTETTKLENEILEEARTVSGRILDDGRKEISDEVAKIRFDLGKRSEQLAREMATSILGKEVS